MLSRTLRPSHLQASKTFPVILLTGPHEEKPAKGLKIGYMGVMALREDLKDH
jgi:hypothetical protein